MSARARRHAAAALVSVLTVGGTLMLSACDPQGTAGAASGTTAPTSAATPSNGTRPVAPSPSGTTASATPSAPPSPTASVPSASSTPAGGAPAPARNGAAKGLTVSNGTDLVLMNGTAVDFHTVVRDLAWSPDGSRAAFVDGDGNLSVSLGDGSRRVVVARNPGGQTWSHPTWQVDAADTVDRIPAKDNILFTVAQGGTTRLVGVPATAVGAAPTPLPLGTYADDDAKPLPGTGNVWINGGGLQHGTTVYANTADHEVYIRDDYLRQQGGAVASGSEPALSRDGDEIVFVRSVAGHDHLFVQDVHANGPVARDLTPHATTDYTEPAWSPDGRTIAARTPAGVVTLPADGSAVPVLVFAGPGLPAYRG